MVLDEIMTPDPVTGSPDWTLRQVLETFLEHDIRHLPIVHGGELIGMITDREVSRELLPEDSTRDHPDEAREHLEKSVCDVMLGDGMLTLESEADINDAVELMVDQKLGAIAVLHPEDGSLVGIVTWVDVLRAARGLFD